MQPQTNRGVDQMLDRAHLSRLLAQAIANKQAGKQAAADHAAAQLVAALKREGINPNG
jgi:hypothetical protein